MPSHRFITFMVLNFVLNSMAFEVTINVTGSNSLHYLPRFWTNTGFCPMGAITNDEISNFLLSNDVEMNLEYISALPNNALSKVRIHWLFELIRFIGLQSRRVPIYDFSLLDQFLDKMVRANLSVGFELMGNPNKMFNLQNVSMSALWQDLVFSIGRRYKIRYGTHIIKNWEFETWNEPDLKTYNLLDFTVADYLDHLIMIRRALDAVGRTTNNTHFALSGPAGLFKNISHHPLCWNALKYCNDHGKCPFDRITFHRKGSEHGADEVLSGGLELMKSIYTNFPGLKGFKFSNNEADPVSGWSTPRPFQSDVRYAIILIDIILQHWSAKLSTEIFENLHSISHDNAFLSYHPFEFDQRTLLARFKMNLTNPPHTQFIQKPVYAALGLLGNLAQFADDVVHIQDLNVTYLYTRNDLKHPLYSAIMMLVNGHSSRSEFVVNVSLPILGPDENISSLIEVIESDISDPVKIWKYYGSPAYPNATLRNLLRDIQGPMVINSTIFSTKNESGPNSFIQFYLSLKTPSIVMLRICSSINSLPPKPKNLRVHRVSSSEVVLFWIEIYQAERCIRTYEVYFKEHGKQEWMFITENKHIPFLSYQYQPKDGIIEGDYKVRAMNMFGRSGLYSDVVPYK